MIYDFGCLGPLDFSRIALALPGAVAAFAITAGLAVIGARISRSPHFRARDIFSGWGVVAGIMNVAAISSTKALPFVTLALLLLMAIAFIPALKNRFFVAPFWLLALFPGLFILTAINLAGIAKWDDFSHWVPNALYLFRYNSVPAFSLPPSPSAWPGYPYALPFLTYMASWLCGGFLMQGGAMINFLLLIAFASMLVETLTPSPPPRPLNPGAIGRTALALLLVTLANPGFNASFSVTNQGDTPTMVLVGALALMLWQMTGRLQAKDLAGPITLGLSLASTGMALVLIKQSNLALLGLLIIGFLIVATKNRILKPALPPALFLFAPAFVLRLVWQTYTDTHIPADDIFHMRPLNAWRFDLLRPILSAMMQAMLKGNGLTLLMLAVSLYGGASVFRRPSPSRNFAILVTVTYVGYLAFLLTTYIGASFNAEEAARATSFYRYCTHTSLLGISFLWMIAPAAWKRSKKFFVRSPHWSRFFGSRILRITSLGVLIIFLPLAYTIHADWIVPQPFASLCAVREFGHKLALALPDHTNLVTLEPESFGLYTYIVNLEFDLEGARTDRTLRANSFLDRYHKFERAKLDNYFDLITADKRITAILVPKAEHEPLKIADENNADGPLVLLRDGTVWRRFNFTNENLK